jgi:hypothetical protein
MNEQQQQKKSEVRTKLILLAVVDHYNIIYTPTRGVQVI